MTHSEILEILGKKIINEVRDEVIEINELILNGKMGSKENKELYQVYQNVAPEVQKIIKRFILEAVDKTLHHFLWMIEKNEEIVLSFKNLNQSFNIKEISDGLCGELYTEEGWIKKYSKYPSSIMDD